MSHLIECVIETNEHESGLVYFVKPCPSFGITARAGARIVNADSDPIWKDIQRYALDYQQPAKFRVLIELEDEFTNCSPNTVKSLHVIETR